ADVLDGTICAAVGLAPGRRHVRALSKPHDFPREPNDNEKLIPVSRPSSRSSELGPRWGMLGYELRLETRQITNDFPRTQVRQRAVLHDFACLGHAVHPQWGSGGRGFKSRRPDFKQ